MGKHWHWHFDVKCHVCKQPLFPRVTCVAKKKRGCPIPKIAVCSSCRGLKAA